MKNILKILIPLLLAVVILYFIFSKIDIQLLWSRISHAKISWVLIGVTISIFAHLSRAYRWNLMLEPLGYTPTLKNTFIAVMVGYFGNIFIPRGGEVMRCMVLTKVDNVPFNASFGTVVAERVFDFLCLLFLMGCAFLMEFDRFSHFFTEFVLKKKEGPGTESLLNNTVFIGLAAAGLIIVIAFLVFRKKIMDSVAYVKVQSFVSGLIKGLISIRYMKKRNAFLVHSFLIWVGYYLMTYLMFFSLPATSGLDLSAGLVILIVGGLGMSAPVSGGIGPFHLMVAGALQLFYGLQHEDGIAYAFVIHTSQLVSLLVIGGICALWVLVLNKNKKTESNTSEIDR